MSPIPARRSGARLLAMVVFAVGIAAGSVHAQAPAAAPDTKAVRSASDLDSLVGRWVRPDGGYVVTINSVGDGGKLDAAYANPRSLPFSRAEATRDGDGIAVFLELRAGGYDGSTYTLRYDPETDVLRGVYYQAVAKQRFDVYFARAR